MDDRCYPEMIRVYQREGGGPISILSIRWLLRRMFYAWLPLQLANEITPNLQSLIQIELSEINITIRYTPIWRPALMLFEPTTIPDVILITPQVFGDERGFFLETYQAQRFGAAGLPFHLRPG